MILRFQFWRRRIPHEFIHFNLLKRKRQHVLLSGILLTRLVLAWRILFFLPSYSSNQFPDMLLNSQKSCKNANDLCEAVAVIEDALQVLPNVWRILYSDEIDESSSQEKFFLRYFLCCWLRNGPLSYIFSNEWWPSFSIIPIATSFTLARPLVPRLEIFQCPGMCAGVKTFISGYFSFQICKSSSIWPRRFSRYWESLPWAETRAAATQLSMRK